MVKKVMVKARAVMLSAMLFTAMIPATAFASSTSEGADISMSAKQSSSDSASASDSASGNQSSKADAVKASISKEKAEELARKSVNIPKDYALQGANLSTDRLVDGTRNVWSLDFVKRANGKYVGSIYTSINADSGQLIGFSSYKNNANVKPSYPLKVEREEAQQIAASFIKEIAGDYAAQVELNENYGAQLLPALTGEVRHQFRFDRIVNSIPFLDNYIYVSVDSEGHVVEYQFTWDDTISFPKITDYMSMEQAAAKLKAAGAPQLSYIVLNNGESKGKPILTYELAPYAINAVTGEKLSDNNYRYYRVQGEVSESPVTDKPLAAKPQSGSIKEQEALDKVKAAFKLPEGAELDNSSYNEYTDGDSGVSNESWNFSWTIKKDGKEAGSIRATVDGKTGVVYNYNIYWHNQDSAGTDELVTLEKATSTAVDTVKKQLPWLTHELHVIKPDPKQYEDIRSLSRSSYYIGFAHKVHGANVDYDNVIVEIDVRTGEVNGFEAYIQPYAYPTEAPTTISTDDALTKWMDYYRPELTYRVVNEYSWNGQPIPLEKYNVLLASGELDSNSDVDRESKIELVYRLAAKPVDERVFLDATNGQWRSYESGEVTQLERPKITDAEGHWAQHQLELMVAYKALDVVDGKVRPNEAIKRGELIKMLVIAKSGGNYAYATADSGATKNASFNDVAAGSEYFAYVESALQQNLIDLGDGSFNPEGTVTREEMAELIVRALGYNSLAQYEDIFVDNFKDSSQIKNKGQATIVVGLDIMSLNKDGKFMPNKQVQRAEAATAFFRYLQARAKLQEAPLRM